MYECSQGIALSLSAEVYASGAEGNLYEVLAPEAWRGCLAKIYHEHRLHQQKQAKINYLIQHPIEGPFAWPRTGIYRRDGSGFVGFILPKLWGKSLELFCSPNLPKDLPLPWSAYERDQPQALGLRLRLAYNLATALGKLHEGACYVFADLKPDNVLVAEDGSVYLLDLDSVAIQGRSGELLFPAEVLTPEYSPAEYHRGDLEPSYGVLRPSWDYFALGVILYRLFLGIHPFAASSRGVYARATSLGQKIQGGLFVHRLDLADGFEVVPPPHRGFYDLPKAWQELWLACFVEGHERAEARPSAQAWLETLGSEALLWRPNWAEGFKPLPPPQAQTWLDRFWQAYELPKDSKAHQLLPPPDPPEQALGFWQSPQSQALRLGAKLSLGFLGLSTLLSLVSPWGRWLWRGFFVLGFRSPLLLFFALALLWTYLRYYQKQIQQTRQNKAKTLAWQKWEQLAQVQEQRNKYLQQLKQRREELKPQIWNWIKTPVQNLWSKQMQQTWQEQNLKLQTLRNQAQEQLQLESQNLQTQRNQLHLWLQNPKFQDLQGPNLESKIHHLQNTWPEHPYLNELLQKQTQINQDLQALHRHYDQIHRQLNQQAQSLKIHLSMQITSLVEQIRQELALDQQAELQAYQRLKQLVQDLEAQIQILSQS